MKTKTIIAAAVIAASLAFVVGQHTYPIGPAAAAGPMG